MFRLIKSSLRSIHLSSALSKDKNVALVLSGCGVYDGSEITEAVSCAIHLQKHNANVHFFAPNQPQMHVINHLTGQIHVENRNVLEESARIARGKILPLSSIQAADYDAIIVPGGFGAAKNLSTYATRGVNMKVVKDLERILLEFIAGRKPIGLCCISPVIIASLIPTVQVTVGHETNNDGQWPYSGTAKDVQLMGAKTVSKDVNEVCVDTNFNVITTPAFMKEASFAQVFDGIGKMIEEVLKRC